MTIRLLAPGLALAFAWSAQAQAPITTAPLPPPRGTAPGLTVPGASVPGLTVPGAIVPGAIVPGASGPQAGLPVSAPWLPRETATIQFLDKVNAQNAAESVKVGRSVQYGSITVLVRACVVRPSDRPADAAAYLEVTDRTIPSAPVFSGWMLRSEPSLSMLEHPIYDLRVTGCTA